MSGQRTDRQLADEAARWRRELRSTQAVLADANRMLLGVYLRARLTDPGDFDVYVGTTSVLDARGAIVWTRVDQALEELLERKPHLATPGTRPAEERRPSALQWLSTET